MNGEDYNEDDIESVDLRQKSVLYDMRFDALTNHVHLCDNYELIRKTLIMVERFFNDMGYENTAEEICHTLAITRKVEEEESEHKKGSLRQDH